MLNKFYEKSNGYDSTYYYYKKDTIIVCLIVGINLSYLPLSDPTDNNLCLYRYNHISMELIRNSKYTKTGINCIKVDEYNSIYLEKISSLRRKASNFHTYNKVPISFIEEFLCNFVETNNSCNKIVEECLLRK